MAFLIGSAFQSFGISEKIFGNSKKAKLLRQQVYKIVIIYLLFKIGFSGGKAVNTDVLNEVLITSIIAIIASVLWTLFLLRVFEKWSEFSPLSQISIAAHFGSVSVGTFIAGLAFLKAYGIEISGSVAIWLALMELPAIFVGMWKLKIKWRHVLGIIKDDWSLIVLVVSIIFGIFGSKLVPPTVNQFLFSTIFTPILVYFLFEMGRKASSSLGQLKGKIKSVLFVGIAIPILGGIVGVSLGQLFGYTQGQQFIMALLMASASYVLAPISMQEILKSIYKPDAKEIQDIIATSMALSVGVTLPFNILIGFELYHTFISVMTYAPSLAWAGISLPIVLYIWASTKKGKNTKAV